MTNHNIFCLCDPSRLRGQELFTAKPQERKEIAKNPTHIWLRFYAILISRHQKSEAVPSIIKNQWIKAVLNFNRTIMNNSVDLLNYKNPAP
jgi:hypothetical protein